MVCKYYLLKACLDTKTLIIKISIHYIHFIWLYEEPAQQDARLDSVTVSLLFFYLIWHIVRRAGLSMLDILIWEDQSFFKRSILMAHAESWGQNVIFFVDQLVLYLPRTSCQHFSVGKVDPKVWQNISEISRTAQMSSSITGILEVN